MVQMQQQQQQALLAAVTITLVLMLVELQLARPMACTSTLLTTLLVQGRLLLLLLLLLLEPHCLPATQATTTTLPQHIHHPPTPLQPTPCQVTKGAVMQHPSMGVAGMAVVLLLPGSRQRRQRLVGC
jgi:hypothetical protein